MGRRSEQSAGGAIFITITLSRKRQWGVRELNR